MTRTLVLGGAGFLGSHLVESLVSKGEQVVVADDFSSGLENNLSSVKDKIEFIKASAGELKYEERLDWVINFASRASRGEWEKYPVEVALTASIGSNNAIGIALKNNARYIFASTPEIYGNPEVVPTPESYVGRVNPIGPRSPYDEGKRFGEALTKAYERQYNLDNIILRFFNAYGPRIRARDIYGRVVGRFLKQALTDSPVTVYGDGKQTRSFTYVSDIVNGVLTIMEKGKSKEVYNIGTNEEVRIVDLANTVIKVTNSKSKIEFLPLPEDDPQRRAADISKIRVLGWEPTTSLESGLAKMASYMRSVGPAHW